MTNALYAHTPLVIAAGHQVRSTIGQEVMLSNVDSVSLPRPLVKWSAEPASARDVLRTIGQGIHTAVLEPAGPVYVSIPYGDWAHETGPEEEYLGDRTVETAGELSAGQVANLVAALGNCLPEGTKLLQIPAIRAKQRGHPWDGRWCF